MKTRHIIAIGLLSALAVGILGLAIHTGKAKTKTFQAKADNTEITLTTLIDEDNEHWYNGTTTNLGNNYSLLDFSQVYMLVNYKIEYKQIMNAGSTKYVLDFYEQCKVDYTYIPDDEYRALKTNDFGYYGTWNKFATAERNAPFPSTFYYDIEVGLEITGNKLMTDWYIGLYENEDNITGVTKTITNPQFYEHIYNLDDEIIDGTDRYGNNIYQISINFVNTPNSYFAVENNSQFITQQSPYNEGFAEGYQTGYTEGLTNGTTTGYQSGYSAGYGIGYSDSDAFNHPIALQPLMLNILTMPFTFIAQAFDVTLWPGTAYEFNIANFIKGMIAIATIMFIIKLFTSGFSIIGNYTGNHYQNKLTRQKIKESKSRTDLNNKTNPNTKTKIIKKG